MEIPVAKPEPLAEASDSCKQAPRPRGRPRVFDREQALETAMRLFWCRGYEATSLSELTAAMGIAAPSLYAAFGSKEQLFRAALARYIDGYRCNGGRVLADESMSTRQAFEAFFEAITQSFVESEQRSGCMLIAAEAGGLPAELREELARYRSALENQFVLRIERGMRVGDLPADTDAAALAKFLTALTQGLSIQARDGATTEQLAQIVRIAMRAWPSA
ncbi:bacterial regulatory, tetR family protein [Lysobacter antibioticus]|uniref:Bacterial regulatory, tetR family protein n=2 Tax=Lysobacter antibioticus TaxID=84531 RepID=A0A0S2FAA9_LYSAN|nr:bacterial regulatory, tetR family protein [Lysobacter antibioticus]